MDDFSETLSAGYTNRPVGGDKWLAASKIEYSMPKE